MNSNELWFAGWLAGWPSGGVRVPHIGRLLSVSARSGDEVAGGNKTLPMKQEAMKRDPLDF